MYKNLQAEQARKNMTNQQVADYLHISRVSYEPKSQLYANCLNVVLNIYLQQTNRKQHKRRKGMRKNEYK